MKPVLIAFHLFMIIFYIGVGGSLLFTGYFPELDGMARSILGGVLIAFAGYRCFFLYKKLTASG
ncbi:MAG: hypothetical protein K1X61_13820 [Chitinophagales bacterium]|nr:hypothetical protein [Chitinophagales bacterium]